MTKSFKIVKQEQREGCTRSFLMVDGKVRGTIQTNSFYHKGFRQVKTWYNVYLHHQIDLCPSLYWAAHIEHCKLCAQFRPRKTYKGGRAQLEDTQLTHKRMIEWIDHQLTKGEE
jgi:hypothetical protein